MPKGQLLLCIEYLALFPVMNKLRNTLFTSHEGEGSLEMFSFLVGERIRYEVGQKVCSGFSIISYKKIQMDFLANPIKSIAAILGKWNIS